MNTTYIDLEECYNVRIIKAKEEQKIDIFENLSASVHAKREEGASCFELAVEFNLPDPGNRMPVIEFDTCFQDEHLFGDEEITINLWNLFFSNSQPNDFDELASRIFNRILVLEIEETDAKEFADTALRLTLKVAISPDKRQVFSSTGILSSADYEELKSHFKT